MEATIQSVLTHHFTDYAQQHPQPLHKHKAAQSVIQCRTAALGGHRQSCPEGHIEQICYNSCKHRACPKCSALPTERWLEAQKAKLLDCDHYHAIFTTPSTRGPLVVQQPSYGRFTVPHGDCNVNGTIGR